MPLLSEAFQIIDNPQPSLIKDLEAFAQKYWGHEHLPQEELDNNFFAKERAVIVVYPQNEIIGRLYLYTRQVVFDGETYKLGGIGGVLVHPRYRKQGMATQMLEMAIEYFEDNNIDFALLNTDIPKFGRLYAGVGFKPLGRSYEFVDKTGNKKSEESGMIRAIKNPEIVDKIISSPEILMIAESNF